jgi:7,8-dihydroneopterin aldolase/epimerase/oxygenase
MTDVRISLSGIRAEGRHGANRGERDFPQEFLVDVSLVLDVPEDSLESTLDYRIVAQIVRETVGGRSFVLLESLADAIAGAMFEYATVAEATAVVHKPAAAASLGIEDVSAEVTSQ